MYHFDNLNLSKEIDGRRESPVRLALWVYMKVSVYVYMYHEGP